MENVVNFLGESEELEFASRVTDRGEAADEFPHAGGVDVVDMGEVENDFLFVGGDELADSIAKQASFVAERDAPVDVDDGDVADFASGDVHGRYLPDRNYEPTQSTTEARITEEMLNEKASGSAPRGYWAAGIG
jgi:hypothetical protein